MTAAGVPSNDITFTCLIEAAVLAGEVDMAQRVFARAMTAGVTNSVQVRRAGAVGLCCATWVGGRSFVLESHAAACVQDSCAWLLEG